VLLLLVGALAPGAHAVEWRSARDLPEPRQEVAVAELSGRVYVVGGFRANPFGVANPFEVADTVEVYDPVLDDWGVAAPLPTPVHHAAAVSVGGRLYVVGGWPDRFFATPLASVYAYDPGRDGWSVCSPMPTARGSVAVAAWEGRIYAMGGSPAVRERDFAVYDPGMDAWTPLPDLLTPRNHLAAGAIGGLIYAVGGRIGSLFPSQNTGALEAYDVVGGRWLELPPMPTPRSGVAGAVVGGRLIVFGGEGNDEDPDGVFDEVEAYDPVSAAWTPLPSMPTPRHGIGAAVVDDAVYIPGGGPVEGFGVTGVHEILVPEPGALGMGLAALASASLMAGRGGFVRLLRSRAPSAPPCPPS
jgi:N-acetylneuraminic acid mutarotase